MALIEKAPGRQQLRNPVVKMCGALVISQILLAVLVESGSVNDCQGVRTAYSSKGLDFKDVPRQPRQGTHLQICPRGLTCCTEEMERKFWSMSRDSYNKALHSSTSPIRTLFSQRARKFDEFFTDLLATSKLKFHKLFQKTYGIIYERNSDVFIDFFKDLEAYYHNGEVDLEEALRKFFSQLYQRMFIVFNAQHSFDYTYLSCVSQTMKKLQPFGDVPKKLTEQLRRSFVATRTFAQALLEGKQIVNKILKITPKDECVVALTKMSNCPACQGLPKIRPCEDYCINVMKGCLAYHAELGESWDKFIDGLQQVSDRLVGPFDIEAVVDPIGVKISDAIMNFQNSGYEVTGKVFQDCGTPKMQKRQASHYTYTAGSAYGYADGGDETLDTKLKNLIKEIKTSVEGTKGFWSKLPYGMCHGSDTAECWNGRDAGRYTNAVVADGLVHQGENPEVRVDIARPDVYINEQIFALRLITKRLENAYNGQSVQWPQPQTTYYEPASESSGDGCDPYSDDEDCHHPGAYYDYEGSGSGDEDWDESSGVEEEVDEQDEQSNWPPWVTAKPPPSSSNNDVQIEDSSSSTSSGKTSGVGTAVLGIVYYFVPIATCFLGSGRLFEVAW